MRRGDRRAFDSGGFRFVYVLAGRLTRCLANRYRSWPLPLQLSNADDAENSMQSAGTSAEGYNQHSVRQMPLFDHANHAKGL